MSITPSFYISQDELTQEGVNLPGWYFVYVEVNPDLSAESYIVGPFDSGEKANLIKSNMDHGVDWLN